MFSNKAINLTLKCQDILIEKDGSLHSAKFRLFGNQEAYDRKDKFDQTD